MSRVNDEHVDWFAENDSDCDDLDVLNDQPFKDASYNSNTNKY